VARETGISESGRANRCPQLPARFSRDRGLPQPLRGSGSCKADRRRGACVLSRNGVYRTIVPAGDRATIRPDRQLSCSPARRLPGCVRIVGRPGLAMNAKKNARKTRKCACCGGVFVVEPRLGKRHRFCALPACRRAGHARARARWLKQNGGKAYHRGRASIERVQDWRRAHPRYWRRGRKSNSANAMRSLIAKAVAAAIGNDALQETIDMPLALVVGLVSRITKSTLHETIAKEVGRLMLRGHEILRAIADESA